MERRFGLVSSSCTVLETGKLTANKHIIWKKKEEMRKKKEIGVAKCCK